MMRRALVVVVVCLSVIGCKDPKGVKVDLTAGFDVPDWVSWDGRIPMDILTDQGWPDICIPDCIGKICGDDGCGGTCGKCPAEYMCSEDGQCVADCELACDGLACGLAGP